MTVSTSLFLHRSFKSFADAMIKVFISLLVYKITHDMLLSVLYVVLDYTFTSLFFVILKKFATKFPVLSIILHVFPLIATQFVLLCEFSWGLIIVLAVLDGLQNSLYYGSLYMIFGLADKKLNAVKFETGENIGKIFFSIASAIFLDMFIESLLFIVIVSVVFYVISISMLIPKYKELVASIKTLQKNNPMEVLKSSKQFNWFNTFYGATSVVICTLIPLFLYENGISFSVVGILVSLKEVVNILANYTYKGIKNIKAIKVLMIIFSFAISAMIVPTMILSNVYVLFVLNLAMTYCFQFVYVATFEHLAIQQTALGYYHDSIFYRNIISNFFRIPPASVYLAIPIFPVTFAVGMVSSGFMGIFASKAVGSTEEILKSINNTTNSSIANDSTLE